MDGKDYHFLQRAEFERRRAAKQFAEWAEVHGNLYGTPLDPVKQTLRQGTDLLFDIDVQGAAQLKLSLAEAVFVFILPPGLDELERRLRGRGWTMRRAFSAVWPMPGQEMGRVPLVRRSGG